MIKHSKRGIEKSLSLFEVFIFVISIFTFAYLIGEEFQSVGASGIVTAPPPSVFPTVTGVSTTTAASGAGASGVALAEPAVSAAAAPSSTLAGVIAPYGAGPGASATAGGVAAGGVTEAGTGGFNLVTHLSTVISTNLESITINLAIAVAIWAGVTYGIGALCPSCSKEMLSTLGLYLGTGYAVGSMVAILIAGKASAGILGLAGGPYGLIGLAVAFILFTIFYRESKVDTVIFNCYPWQPKTGGADCDKCNKGDFPCTEYKCDILGQSCKLLNGGTDQEECTYIGKNDISAPTISAWDGPLTEGYSYVPDTARLPPDRGVIIKYDGSSDGCAPPFSRIDYGITLNEPGSCKIDTVRTDSIDTMRVTIDKGYYLYNHTLFSLNAGANESSAQGVTYSSGGNYEVFIRCQDGNANANTGTFAFKYCVQNTPDTTAPSIKLTNPINGMPVTVGTSSAKIDVYTDKPADCRWSHTDEDYDTMAGTMSCSNSIADINANMLYKCTTTLTGLKDQAENKFYFRCDSYPDQSSNMRVKNTESYVYTLMGTQPLVIDSLTPASGATISDATSSVKVTIAAQTSAGYNLGDAKCYIKETSKTDSSYSLFFSDTSQYNYAHSQDLYLTKGDYDYSVKCCDLGANCATKETSFTVDTDFEAPLVARAYNENGQLNIITTEAADCVYDTTSCSYNFDDGVKMTSPDQLSHTTEWNTANNFYIKCKDVFGNEPAPDQCSITVRPFSGY